MFTRTTLLAAAVALMTVPALAQTAAPAPAPAAPPATMAPAPAAPAPEMTKDGRPTMKSVRDTCKMQMKGSGMKGDAKRQAMADCMIKQRPDKAAGIKCRMDPSLKGMDKDAKRDAVKACVKKSRM